MWDSFKGEVRELVWLASVVGGLSILSVGAVVLAAYAMHT